MNQDYVFSVGDPVEKRQGYSFPGVVVSTYRTLKGEPRYVVECVIPGVEGCQHIFNANQLRARETGE